MRYLTVALALATSLFGTANAGDIKLYPGASCQAVGGARSYVINGLIRNDSSGSAVDINCPIARDATGSTSIRVYVEDKHFNQDVACYTSSVNDYNYAGSWSPWVRSSGVTGAIPTPLDLPTTSGTSSSFQYVTCTLPPVYSGQMSGLRSMFVNEN